MKKKNIAWLLSAAMILGTAATPLEIMPVYAAEEFQADETEEAGTAETTATTAADVAEDTTENGPVENATAETAESEETVDAESGTEEAEETADEVSGENTQDDNTSDLDMFDDSAEELNEESDADSSNTAETETDAESGFSDGGNGDVVTDESSEVVDSGKCGTNATYTLYGDGRLVIEGSGTVYNQFNLITSSNKKIKSVEIGEGITALDYSDSNGGVFAYCEDLTSVTLPKSLTTLGNNTFYQCSNLKTIVLPENITKIGSYAFSGCSLKSIELPGTLNEIGDYAFEKNAFRTITIPDTVTDIGAGAFSGCSDLRSIKLSENLKRISNGTFLDCERLDSIVLPDGITEIAGGAFSNSGLTEVKLPENLITIGNAAFYWSKISVINFPESLKTIGEDAFEGNNLKSVELPDGITEIGESAFGLNYNLNSINIPKNVTEIKEGTFRGCSSLQNVTFPDGLLKIEKNAFNGTSLTGVILPDSVTTLEESAFENCGLNEVKFSKNLTEIPYGAFSGCRNLIEVVLPDNITYVDTNAFFDCTNLRSAYITNASTVIEKKAFAYNSDGTRDYNFVIMGHKGSAAETYAAENSFNFHNIEDPLTYHAEVKPTCTSNGNWEYWHCDKCNRDFSNAEGSTIVYGDLTISKLEHDLTFFSWKSATCTEPGRMMYYHCDTCGKNFADSSGETEISDQEIVIPANGHNMQYHEAINASCTGNGNKEYYYCTDCEKYFLDQEGKQEVSREDVIIPANENHNMQHHQEEPATCINNGNKEYYYCKKCNRFFLDEEGKQEVSGEDVIIPVNENHSMRHCQEEPANCISSGTKEYYYCNNCGRFFLDQEGKQEVTRQDLVIPEDKNNHNIRCEKGYEATCVREGMKTYYICNNCGKIFLDENGTQEVTEEDLIIPRNENHRLMFCPGRAADCGNSGQIDYYHCGECGKDFRDKEAKEEVMQDSDLFIPPTGHKWSAWKLIPMNGYAQGFPAGKSCQIDIISDYLKERKCERCGQTEGKGLTYAIHVNTDRITLKYGQSTTAVRVSGFKNGDYLKSVTPKNKDLVTISNINRNGTFKVTAKKKSGSTRATIKLNSGMSADIMVTVQKGNVSTRYITNLRSTIIVKGKTVTLNPMLDPITSQDKVTYSTSDKNIATVTSGGVVTGKQVGTAKITVKAGSKKVVVTIKVTPRIKTKKLTGVPKTKTVTRGKTFTVKAAASPRNTDEKITYKSSNSKIATVTSKGVVKGIRKGTATITVQSGSKKLICKVTVK